MGEFSRRIRLYFIGGSGESIIKKIHKAFIGRCFLHRLIRGLYSMGGIYYRSYETIKKANGAIVKLLSRLNAKPIFRA